MLAISALPEFWKFGQAVETNAFPPAPPVAWHAFRVRLTNQTIVGRDALYL